MRRLRGGGAFFGYFDTVEGAQVARALMAQAEVDPPDVMLGFRKANRQNVKR